MISLWSHSVVFKREIIAGFSLTFIRAWSCPYSSSAYWKYYLCHGPDTLCHRIFVKWWDLTLFETCKGCVLYSITKVSLFYIVHIPSHYLNLCFISFSHVMSVMFFPQSIERIEACFWRNFFCWLWYVEDILFRLILLLENIYKNSVRSVWAMYSRGRLQIGGKFRHNFVLTSHMMMILHSMIYILFYISFLSSLNQSIFCYLISQSKVKFKF